MEYKQYLKTFLDEAGKILSGKISISNNLIIFISNKYKWVYHWSNNNLIEMYNQMTDVKQAVNVFIDTVVNEWVGLVFK